MKQRVVMVLSTLLDPSLLIADEITSALDVSTQRAVAEMLVEFRDRGFVKSTIVITHDLSILYQIADTILVMYAGKLVEKATAAEITEDPRHPYTRLLLGSLPEVGVRFTERRLKGIPGPAAVAAQPSDRVPLPRPLPARVREVRRGAAVRRGRAGTVRRLLEGVRLMLRLDGVTKVFKTGTFGGAELTAVSDVTFEIEPGEVVALIGESGSGKTTVGQDDPAPDPGHGRDDHVRRAGRDDARRPSAPRLLQARPGRLPGPVQLVQPRVQGRPRLRDDPRELPRRAQPRRSGARSCGRRSKRWRSSRRTCSASIRTS